MNRGIPVSITGGGEDGADPAEHALALILSASRRISENDAAVRRGDFQEAVAPGRRLSGKTLGILGYGLLGKRVAGYCRALVDGAYFGPLGNRSFGGGRPAFTEGIGITDMKAHLTRCNEELCVSIMVETRGALEAAGDIAALPGVDYMSFGLMDLAQSLGHPGDPRHPEVAAAVADATKRIRAAGNAVLKTLIMDDCASRIDVATSFLRNCFGKQPEVAEFAFALAYNMLCPFEIRNQIGQWQTAQSVSEEALRRVKVPTQIVHGRRDILVLPGAAQITADLIPHAEVQLYDDCGHSVFFESADRFNAEFASFVEKAWKRANSEGTTV